MGGAVSLLTIRLHGNFTHLYWPILTINLHDRAKFCLVDFLEELDINTLLFDIKYKHNCDLKLFFIR